MASEYTCSWCGRVHDCPINPNCHLDPQRHEVVGHCNTFDPDGHP